MSNLKKLAQQQKAEQFVEKIIYPFGYPLMHHIGLYYVCNIDHKRNEYNFKEKHCHRVVDARYIKRTGYIYDGMSYKDASGAWHTGCKGSYFHEHNNKTCPLNVRKLTTTFYEGGEKMSDKRIGNLTVSELEALIKECLREFEEEKKQFTDKEYKALWVKPYTTTDGFRCSES